jgi:hypothetical protein
MTCAASPWSGISNPPPSTILLPAGTIQIPSTWILPNNTKLIGEQTTDPALNSTGSALQTTIQANNSLSSGAMIQFGDSTHCPSSVCTGISVENLTLVGNSQALTGILNENAQDLSYVDHVTLYGILGTGLSIGVNSGGGDAHNSGPYSNINYDAERLGVSGSTCASINGLSSTHGIHGLSCISNPESQAAVLLDSSNNTLEEIRMVGFADGILVGSKATANSNVLRNVIGDTTTGSKLLPVYVVRISTNNPVSDLSIMGVNNILGGPAGEFAIYDEVTTKLISDSYVAMYALGQAKNNGHSRYTTSPNAAIWAFGSNAPTGSCSKSLASSWFAVLG